MKAIYLKAAGAIALTASTAFIAACVPSVNVPLLPTEPTVPVAAPSPAPASTPQPAPVIQEQQYANYLDAPQSPGTWNYANDPNETLATYGTGTQYDFIIRCDKSTRRIGLGRAVRSQNGATRAMQISTETTTRQLQAPPVNNNLLLVAASLNPNDSLLDAMAITKGRFAVAVEGERTLYIPAWVEVTRVIEDCR